MVVWKPSVANTRTRHALPPGNRAVLTAIPSEKSSRVSVCQVAPSSVERSPRQVLVTREGEAVLKRAERVLTEARGLLDAARERTAPLAGPFRLGALPTLGPYVLPYVIQPLRGAFPRMPTDKRSAT